MFSAILLASSVAMAQVLAPSPWGPIAGDHTVTLVVSGGVSEGAYLAGQLYVLSEAIKEGAGDSPPTVVVTGASAGSVGAVLTAVELLTRGNQPVTTPESSVFFRFWVPFGISPDAHSLYRFGQEKQDSIFNDAYIDEVLLALPAYVRKMTVLGGGWDGEVYIGMQTSRLQPVPIGPASTLSEAFVFRMDLEGDAIIGTPVRRTPQKVPQERAGLASVARIARISGSFPGAFAFPSMSCNDYNRWAFFSDRECNLYGAYPDEIKMFDGGLYENNPVGLANDVGTALGRTGSIIYLDPNLDWSPGEDPEHCFGNHKPSEITTSSPIVEMLSSIASTFQQQGLAYQMEYHAERAILPVCQTTSPSSGYFLSFLGFFDRSFRAADFYLGMYDGFRFIDRHPEVFQDSDRLSPEELLGTLLEKRTTGIYHLFRAAFESPQARTIRDKALRVDLVTARSTAEEIVAEVLPAFNDPALYEPIVHTTKLNGEPDPWGLNLPDEAVITDLGAQMEINLALLLRENLFRALANDPDVTRAELESANISASGYGFYTFLEAIDPEVRATDLGLEAECSNLMDDCRVRFRPLDLKLGGTPTSLAEAFIRTTRAIALSSVDMVEAQGSGGPWAEYAVRTLVGKRAKTFAQLGTGPDWNRLGLLANYYPRETTGGRLEYTTSAWLRYGVGLGASLKATAGPHFDIGPGSRTIFGHKGWMIVPRLGMEVELLFPADASLARGLLINPAFDLALYPTSIFTLWAGAAPYSWLPLEGFRTEMQRGWGLEFGLGVALPCLPGARGDRRLCR